MLHRKGDQVGRAWLLQASPAQYDIDEALRQLEPIWWRVPQYTSEIRAGDIALIWRAGKASGIVGIGRVMTDPQLHEIDADERRFMVAGKEEIQATSRVMVQVKPTVHLPRDQVASLPALHNHRVITAPMGTVFPLTEEQWMALQPLIGEPPPPVAGAPVDELPQVFSWDQRTKSVHPMPGGYDGYLVSLRRVLDLVEEHRPTDTELSELLAQEFGVSGRRSYALTVFLRRSGFLQAAGGAVEIGQWAARWRASGDLRIPIALLHSRVRFIGEFLKITMTPRSTAEVLTLANQQYGCGWSTQAQVDRRRGWLQSAGMLQVDASDRLVTTEQGQALLGQLTLFEPQAPLPPRDGDSAAKPPAPQSVAPVVPLVAGPDELLAELRTSSTDSAHPDRFERAVRDAFAFLGFEATWLGAAGRTDVLLDAPLGRGQRYRVIVDCKTSGSGSVTDQQIDWMTLKEHRDKHDAQHAVVVAPAPAGRRLFARAEQQDVLVISVEQLVSLCQQHAQAPLGLHSYLRLFTAGGGSLTAQPVAEDAEEWLRIVHLASAVCEALRSKSALFGPLSARDLLLILADAPAAEATTEAELQLLLDTLASPLVGVLTRTDEGTYRLAAVPEVVAARLRIVAAALGSIPGDTIQQQIEPTGQQ